GQPHIRVPRRVVRHHQRKPGEMHHTGGHWGVYVRRDLVRGPAERRLPPMQRHV
ncbi:unnamed protein product, partial [Ascophyllum nodosum]